MKLNSLKAVCAAAAMVFSLAGGSAQAAPQLTIADDNAPLAVFGGFDWASGGAGFTMGVQQAAANFQTGGDASFKFEYTSWANAITDPDGIPLDTANLDNIANGVKNANKHYEFTLKSQLNLVITNLIDLGGGLTAVEFKLTGGNWDVHYDTNANAKAVVGAWTGFNDGPVVLNGNWLASPDSYIFNPTTVAGLSLSLKGIVIGTDPIYVTPDMASTVLDSNVKLAPVSGLALPSSIDGTSIGANEFVFKVDGDQYFFPVPEPMSLLLAGLGLVAAGATTRRKAKAAAQA